ncbi:hypothetical protein [Nocardia miyunensis]|uniref:hypothetical protein n=1 Tax=Nocardia miyunensis TaxID=282684 RepID=UPI0012F50A32|nr:hypothetical protein [Nocardia miyunensis]
MNSVSMPSCLARYASVGIADLDAWPEQKFPTSDEARHSPPLNTSASTNSSVLVDVTLLPFTS